MGMESPPPTMIEGLGDEVTVAVGLFVLLLALTLAWLSTYVAEGSDPFLGSLMPPVRRDPLLGLSNPVPPTPEPQGPTQPPVEKPEEGERDSGLEQGEGSENANLDQMLDIQGVPKRSQSIPALQEENNAGQELSQEEGRGPENIQDATRIEEHLLEDSRECETLESKQQVEKNVKEIGTVKKEGKRQEEGLISVRLKFLNETEEIAFMRPDDTIGSLKSKYFPGQELQMKLIFQGQLLHDSSQTLRSLHIKDNCVIHCHRSQATAPSSPARPESGGTTPETAGLTTPIGNLMIPLFVIMLALIWYFRINYRQFFTAPATVSLVGVTVFFSFLVFGMYGR